MSKRIACVIIPDFPLLVELMENVIPYDTPAVLTENKKAKVSFLTSRAIVEGVNLDMTIAQAQAICPDLVVLIRDLKKEEKGIKTIVKKLYSISPVVEKNDPGVFYLDLSGLKRLYKSEGKIASKIIKKINGLNFPVKVGIARNKFTSYAGARVCPLSDYKIVDEGKERKFLVPYPVHLLPVDQDLLETLFILGVRSIGEFANLPGEDVLKRYGKEGLMWLKMAKGEDEDPIIPFLPEQKESNGVDLDSSLDTNAGILFYSETILGKLLKRISKKGLLSEEILAKLRLEDFSQVILHLSVSEGTNNTEVFLKLLKLKLEKLSLSAPVKELSFGVKKTSRIKARQLSFQDRETLNSLNQLLPGSRDIVENDKISNPEIPEANPIEDNFSGISRRSLLGLRLFSPPRNIDVIADNGFISYVSIGSNFQKVLRQDGPWKTDGKWWERPFERKYYEVGLNRSEKYLIFRELRSGKWFLKGVFD